MSLPDTVFIFVLALIIFGPKKLPEIGRQLGRLVGEFRRASNEFKFQIEEELRQVDFADKRSTQRTIAAPVDDTATASNESESTALAQDPHDPAENLPVGQHPNIDNLDTSEFNTSAVDSHIPNDSGLEAANAVPTITPAAGSQPRTTFPYAATDSTAESLNAPVPQPTAVNDDFLSTETPASANHHPAQAEAEITHG